MIHYPPLETIDMFLTRFPINRTRRATSRLLGSPYQMHAAIAGSFVPTEGTDSSSRILWRVDDDSDGTLFLYIVSELGPSLVGLDEQIGFPDLTPAWKTRDYGPFLQRLAEGQIWSFRLTANPVRDVARNRSSKNEDAVGKRTGHVTVRQQSSWLIGRAAYANCPPPEIPEGLPSAQDSRSARNGFEVVTDESGGLQLSVSERRVHHMKKRDQPKPITVSTARFDGVLRVTDADKLRHALTHGIGHARAFGCGLLTLAPLVASS